MRPKQPRPEDVLSIEIDWRAYWEDFKAAHGDPVEYGGRLLFADGWTYAMDYAGPEYPPPEDPVQLRRMQIAYWSIVRGQVLDRVRYLERLLTRLSWMADSRDVPLRQRVTSVSEETGAKTSESVPLDLSLIESRLELSRRDLVEVERQLASARERVA